MASPDTDDGWYKLAHELDAALAAADLSKAARIVLREVFAQTYGPALRREAVVSTTALARATGKHKQFIDRGLAELVKGGLLERVADGVFRFIKDYESWTAADGSPRLSRAEVAWCSLAPQIAVSFKHIPSRNGANSPVGQPTHQLATPEPTHQLATQPTTELATQPTHQLAISAPPLRTPLYGGRREKGEEAPSLRSGALAGSAASGSSSPEAADVETWALTLGTDRNMESYAFWARQACGMAPASWVRRLLERKVAGRSGRGRASLPMLTSILAEWVEAGECEYERPAAPTLAVVPAETFEGQAARIADLRARLAAGGGAG